ncbi:hypothetical protein NPIL_91801 [Nephila pilipes]|uniref:Uncharacterized protein n=1 Tax=Nephila pilipes TaxID=299642 RepID=A0A8X6NVF3_NEPPI|nr:hypothetical protein NPIL_91801 [Nephila pilipes]
MKSVKNASKLQLLVPIAISFFGTGRTRVLSKRTHISRRFLRNSRRRFFRLSQEPLDHFSPLTPWCLLFFYICCLFTLPFLQNALSSIKAKQEFNSAEQVYMAAHWVWA